jgi:hypothetical protein
MALEFTFEVKEDLRVALKLPYPWERVATES